MKQIQKRLREKEELTRLRKINSFNLEKHKAGNKNFLTCSKRSKSNNNASHDFFLALIYEMNIIRPTALYLFKECSVLCMPFAELGQSRLFFYLFFGTALFAIIRSYLRLNKIENQLNDE